MLWLVVPDFSAALAPLPLLSSPVDFILLSLLTDWLTECSEVTTKENRNFMAILATVSSASVKLVQQLFLCISQGSCKTSPYCTHSNGDVALFQTLLLPVLSKFCSYISICVFIRLPQCTTLLIWKPYFPICLSTCSHSALEEQLLLKFDMYSPN